LVLLSLKSYNGDFLLPHALGHAPSLPPTSKILVPPMHVWMPKRTQRGKLYWYTLPVLNSANPYICLGGKQCLDQTDITDS